MRDLKYIIVRLKSKGGYKPEPKAILFNGEISHSMIYSEEMQKYYELMSAGFCTVESSVIQVLVTAYGESTSLGCKSKKSDREIIKRTIVRIHMS